MSGSIHARCYKTVDLINGQLRVQLICGRSKGHSGKCRDIDHDLWFNSKSDLRACEECGVASTEVRRVEDPYAAEVNGEKWMRWLDPGCRQSRADDA